MVSRPRAGMGEPLLSPRQEAAAPNMFWHCWAVVVAGVSGNNDSNSNNNNNMCWRCWASVGAWASGCMGAGRAKGEEFRSWLGRLQESSIVVAEALRLWFVRQQWSNGLESHGSSSKVFSDAQLLRGEHIEECFGCGRTRVLDKDAEFAKKVVRRACEIRRKHSVLVLGRCGNGKSSLCNFLRNHEEPKAQTRATDATTVGAHAYQLPANPSPTRSGSGQGFEVDQHFLSDASSSSLGSHDDSEDDLLKPQVLLIDTEGWSSDKAKSIKQAYVDVLQERGIDDSLMPHIVLFVMSASHLREVRQDVASMKQAFAALAQTSEFPVTVIPVVTRADPSMAKSRDASHRQ
ncbi:unnamed protein product [Polarella glacialis]|uniref:G domain-containing protein n=1 Tax=Polarella glacialis TaxID=89957 RepID=A0A813LCY7_POLGL|nr:unnamed protein product [Polarella glacialis]